jgi:glycosyltransferase involved in cell wall biosynthesis
MQKTIDEALDRLEVDLILVEFSQMACFDFPPDVPVVIDQHNLEFDLIRRMANRSPVSFRKLYNWIEALKYRREEVRALRASDLALATSERDANLMRDLVEGLSTAVITNGVDTEYFRNPGREVRPNTLVFVGATHYFPNEDGIHFFMRQVYPLIRREMPDIQVYLVGGRPPESIRQYDSENVEVTGFVDDVRPYMHEAAACIVPLRIGGGTRFKVVEAMAAQTPVVSTSLGSEGIPLEEGRHALLADTPQDFARAVLRVLRDAELAETLRREGLEFVNNNFDWSVIGDRLNDELRRFECDAQ